ncbi:hypothetical protein LV84_01407 [Algoriphagus ratkowskyi]|nr:hypothetical protein LV84_01407 [Algoriphagus ratkowskyi]
MDYTAIRAKCKKTSDFSDPILNELMYYAAQRNKVNQHFDLLAKKHKSIFGRLDQSNQGLFKSQYIIHEIFKKEGLIHKYLNHSAVKSMPQEDYTYLEKQAQMPWRFTYWFFRSSPAPDFFESVDIFTGEEFLLFSPGVSLTLIDSEVATFGGLISSDGSCYQTFGPLTGFRSFQADDIFFYGGELDPLVESIDNLLALIQKDLFSFLLLSVFSAIPMVKHERHEILHVISGIEFTDFDMLLWEKDFRVEYSDEVFKMSLKELDGFPHFCCVYWSEAKEELTLSAMTDFGYDALLNSLKKLGIQVPSEPDIRLHLSMQTAIEDILGNQVDLLPYEKLFQSGSDENVKSPEMDALNDFLNLLVPAVNSKKEVDLDLMISETGADPQAARAIYKDLMKKLKK